MAGSGGHGFPAPSNKQALPSGRERREEGREGGKRPKRDVFLQAGRLGAGRGVLAAGAGLLPLSVNGCRLLPVAAATGRWGRGGPGRCLLLGQVAISDFGSRGFARSSWTQAASEEYPFPSLHWRSCSAPRPLVQAPPTLPIAPDPPRWQCPVRRDMPSHALAPPRSHQASEVPGQGAANAGS